MFVVGQKHLARRCLRSMCVFFSTFFCFGICKRMLWIWNLFIWINKKRPSFPFAATVPWTFRAKFAWRDHGPRFDQSNTTYPTVVWVWTRRLYDQLSQFTSWELPFTSFQKTTKNPWKLIILSWQIESKMVDFPWIGMIGQFTGELPRFSWGTQGISAGCWMMTWCLTEKALLGANWGVPLNFSLPGLWGWWPLKEKQLNFHLLWQILFCLWFKLIPGKINNVLRKGTILKEIHLPTINFQVTCLFSGEYRLFTRFFCQDPCQKTC